MSTQRWVSGGPRAVPESSWAEPMARELITGTLGYDEGGRSAAGGDGGVPELFEGRVEKLVVVG